MVNAYTLGGYLHVFLFLAIAAIIIQLLQGRSVAP
jgi:hypothetical protein